MVSITRLDGILQQVIEGDLHHPHHHQGPANAVDDSGEWIRSNDIVM